MRRFESCLPLHFNSHLTASSQLRNRSLTCMNTEANHISVCICTYKRPELLRRVLSEVGSQETRGLFTISIVVADNDQARSGEPVVSDFVAISSIPVRYCVEPQQGIARARNRAVENSTGNFVAFIDDDEFPTKEWLQNLFITCREYNADGVLGPVKRHFDEKPPDWIAKSKFYERPDHPTGLVMEWRKCRSGNVLLKRELFAGKELAFDPQFRTGEDQDFFRRKIAIGRTFVWCNEAIVYEVVPPIRWKRKFMLKRALLRGAMEPKVATFGIRDVARSLVAVPVYAVALPFALLLGHHRFMSLLVRMCDHLGKLLALVGIHLVKEEYVTE
jgi:succinoglycan biosynthesis protein ExoM